ncbi:MAG TPA: energy-coupling factor transporter ATPase [Clostridiales bacterium UBA8153]|jgi:energy-coupling factor transport system ATP-binding protein|nr:energy-coupling factor transporter ATPase [Clostridiales bacterium UBA8153]
MPIELYDVSYVYAPGTPNAVTALNAVTLRVDDGESLGIIGPTGSGKSTLVQHLNGLLKPARGRVLVDGEDLSQRATNLRNVRRKVGVIFQYPEHQLFEETVAKDIAFGPRNLGVPEAQLQERVRDAMAMVGLPEQLAERSPFELSGGQMRRVAIAGVLAMAPKVLVLDEPTAGLDPRGRAEILAHIRALHHRLGLTLVIVSHNMEDIARMTRRLAVMDRGRVVMDGPTPAVFSQTQRLRGLGLGTPQITAVMEKLRERGLAVRLDVLTVEEARDEIVAGLNRGQSGA